MFQWLKNLFRRKPRMPKAEKFGEKDVILRLGLLPYFVQKRSGQWCVMRESDDKKTVSLVAMFPDQHSAIDAAFLQARPNRPYRQFIPGFRREDGTVEEIRINFPQ